ncbi:sialoadhesin-like isoform X2 [Anabas testudineus]|uniref:Ig-like domain-containing protein n=1 Tax=Anabas testudineus TaxID=64144 RepID=A0A7N6AVU0_ANATE|nr:sialoadhesin-like isoform X2 [Anabas testudineus]
MVMPSVCLILSATLSVIPNRSQFFRYEHFTLRCEVPGVLSNWTVRRNTSSKIAEPCEGGFGDLQNSSCIMKNTYPSDSGVYWCESDGGEELSNAVNITVTAGKVILESPALPLTKEDEVTFHCTYKGRYEAQSRSNFNTTFYRNDVLIRSELQGHMTVKAQEGFYKCQHPKEGESPVSWLAVTAPKLSISPNRCHFFEHEHITLSCDVSGASSRWTVKRNTSSKISESCEGGFGDPHRSSCILKDVGPSDSGVYWCESEGGKELSNAVNITVSVKYKVLSVSATPPTCPPLMSLPTLLCIVLVLILYTAIIIVCVYAYRRWIRARAERRIYEQLTLA